MKPTNRFMLYAFIALCLALFWGTLAAFVKPQMALWTYGVVFTVCLLVQCAVSSGAEVRE